MYARYDRDIRATEAEAAPRVGRSRMGGKAKDSRQGGDGSVQIVP